MMRLQAFFVAHTGTHIPTSHKMCGETLNPHIIGMGTSNLNVQVFCSKSFYDVYYTFVLFWRTIR